MGSCTDVATQNASVTLLSEISEESFLRAGWSRAALTKGEPKGFLASIYDALGVPVSTEIPYPRFVW